MDFDLLLLDGEWWELNGPLFSLTVLKNCKWSPFSLATVLDRSWANACSLGGKAACSWCTSSSALLDADTDVGKWFDDLSMIFRHLHEIYILGSQFLPNVADFRIARTRSSCLFRRLQFSGLSFHLIPLSQRPETVKPKLSALYVCGCWMKIDAICRRRCRAAFTQNFKIKLNTKKWTREATTNNYENQHR